MLRSIEGIRSASTIDGPVVCEYAGCETARSRRWVSVPQAATSRSMAECILWVRRVARLPSAGRNGRNLTPDKTLGPIERMLVGVSTNEQYPALRGWQQLSLQERTSNEQCPTGFGSVRLHIPFCIGAGDGSQGAIYGRR